MVPNGTERPARKQPLVRNLHPLTFGNCARSERVKKVLICLESRDLPIPIPFGFWHIFLIEFLLRISCRFRLLALKIPQNQFGYMKLQSRK